MSRHELEIRTLCYGINSLEGEIERLFAKADRLRIQGLPREEREQDRQTIQRQRPYTEVFVATGSFRL